MKNMTELGWIAPPDAEALDLARRVLAAWQTCPHAHEKHWADVANYAAFLVSRAAKKGELAP